MKTVALNEAGLAVVAILGILAISALLMRAWLRNRDRRMAIRLHATGWTHGQIAEAQGRHPRQVAAWLEADRAGG